jgi:hypothetical protein
MYRYHRRKNRSNVPRSAAAAAPADFELDQQHVHLLVDAVLQTELHMLSKEVSAQPARQLLVLRQVTSGVLQ